jgi:thiol-disulfide isomerase/thioredoxin
LAAWLRFNFKILTMRLAAFCVLVRLIALGLVLTTACTPRAQPGTTANTPLPTPADVSAPTPEPVSPVVSAPQVVLSEPTIPARPESQPAIWLNDLTAALALAKANNRPLVAVFSGSDWCPPCVTYEKEVFSQPGFAAFAQNRLVLAHFDYPRLPKNQLSPDQQQRNAAAAALLNREGDFPLAVVVSPEGKVLAKTGYIVGGPDAFQSYLKQLLPSL